MSRNGPELVNIAAPCDTCLPKASSLPSECMSQAWIFYPAALSKEFYGHIDGKWPLFYSKDVIDQRWKEFVDLFDAGRLPATIISMKCSSALSSRSFLESKDFVINLYCDCGGLKSQLLQTAQELEKLTAETYRKRLYYQPYPDAKREADPALVLTFTPDFEDRYQAPIPGFDIAIK